MRRRTSRNFSRILLALGTFLMATSVLAVTVSYILQKQAAAQAVEIVADLQSLMPEVRDGVPDDRIDMTMPMLELDGSNFVGIIEVPAYGTALPIGGTWDKAMVARFPCRYTGSLYDGSLIIGGSDHAGQLDFMKNITGQDRVWITDTTGARYSYVVTDVEKTNDVSTEHLTSTEAELVLFARGTYSLDYTVVRCALKNKK